MATTSDKTPSDLPMVDTYTKLFSEKKNKYEDYTPHHVAPKSLANWISQKIENIPDDLLEEYNNGELEDIMDNLRKEHNNGGMNLSCILIHKNTHILKTGDPQIDQFRVHHGSATASKVAARMAAQGLDFIEKNSKNQLNEEDIELL